MILHLYIARRFLIAFLLVAVSLAVILIMLDTVEHIRRFGSITGFLQITRLSLLNIPTVMYNILPLLVILASLFMFLGFSRSSEMVVTRAAGRPALVTLMAPIVVVFLLGVLGLMLLNPIAAATSKEYKREVNRLSGHSESIFSVSSEGIWLRQGDGDGQTVIRANGTNPDGTTLNNVSFFAFSQDGLPVTRINAETARLEEGRWALTNAKIWNLQSLDNAEKTAVTRRAYWIATTLTPNQIQDSFAKPSAIPIWELPAFIQKLQEAGFSSRKHRVSFQTDLAMPLFLVAMVLIGAAFTMRHTRLGRTGLMALLALGFGFGIYFIRNFATILGENGQIPVSVAAWTPPIAGVFLALGVILNLEDG
ncbi:MAG TPA: LPS export ABC transporter permease LptG [Aliiroseovarius sp.]|nr:LPS export ABC transporter permease LptG [Aliiroseovarius sp.]